MTRISMCASRIVSVGADWRGRCVPLVLTALVMSSLTSVAAAQVTHVVVQTDTSWRVTGTAPAAGWNTSLAFDDSTWAATQVNVPASPLGTHVIDAIWDSTSTSGGSGMIWVRKRFTLPGPAIAAILDATADDDVELWVNGTRVINDADCLAGPILGTDVRAYLVPGDNLIAALVTDCGGVHTFGMYVDVTAQATAVPALGRSGLVALAVALALAGAFLLRRLMA